VTGESSPTTWAERVRSAWDSRALPDAIVLDDYELNTPDEWDALDIQQWLVGKRYHEIVGTSEIDSYMPFYYLTDDACAYFLGAYLLEVSQVLDRIGGPAFAVIHFSSFVRDERFRAMIELLSEDQRTVLFQLILAMLVMRDVCDLEEEDVAGFEMAAALV
jgi:hypothetical protein